MNSGLYALAGASATATAAACANRLLEPMTNVSKVYFEFSRVPPSLGAGGIAPGPPGSALILAAVLAAPASRRAFPPSCAGCACGAAGRGPWSASATCGPASPCSPTPCRRGAAAPAFPGRGPGPDRTRHRGLRRRVDGDGELDVAAELLGQRLGDQRAQPGLQLFLDELVRRGDEGGVLHQAERPGEFQPGPLVRLDLQVSQPVEGSCPDFCQVRICHLCAPLASPRREPRSRSTKHPHVVHVASPLHTVTAAAWGE